MLQASPTGIPSTGGAAAGPSAQPVQRVHPPAHWKSGPVRVEPDVVLDAFGRPVVRKPVPPPTVDSEGVRVFHVVVANVSECVNY